MDTAQSPSDSAFQLLEMILRSGATFISGDLVCPWNTNISGCFRQTQTHKKHLYMYPANTNTNISACIPGEKADKLLRAEIKLSKSVKFEYFFSKGISRHVRETADDGHVFWQCVIVVINTAISIIVVIVIAVISSSIININIIIISSSSNSSRRFTCCWSAHTACQGCPLPTHRGARYKLGGDGGGDE